LTWRNDGPKSSLRHHLVNAPVVIAGSLQVEETQGGVSIDGRRIRQLSGPEVSCAVKACQERTAGPEPLAWIEGLSSCPEGAPSGRTNVEPPQSALARIPRPADVIAPSRPRVRRRGADRPALAACAHRSLAPFLSSNAPDDPSTAMRGTHARRQRRGEHRVRAAEAGRSPGGRHHPTILEESWACAGFGFTRCAWWRFVIG
jgi:hypothetical protein